MEQEHQDIVEQSVPVDLVAMVDSCKWTRNTWSIGVHMVANCDKGDGQHPTYKVTLLMSSTTHNISRHQNTRSMCTLGVTT